MARKFNSAWDFWGGSLEALGIFGGVDFCPLSLEIRGVTRNLSSMHSICTSPILIILVRLPPPLPLALTKFCISIAINFSGGDCNTQDE